ncbi:MAG: DUF1761 domain-containing protein [Flavobacteriaceae bacterium]|nr:DUF1761 domain-containing protein [Flavobacteriaceae bacterium]
MSVNWIALVVAAILPLGTGFIWYGPLFGKVWMKESGMTEEKAKTMNPGKTYGLAVVMAFILALFIWPMVFLGGAPPDDLHGTEAFLTFKHGALHGSMLALFVVLPVFATNALFEMRSFKYVAINVGYWLVTMALMGGIINAWV